MIQLKNLKFATFILLIISVYLSCVKDDGFSTPNVDCNEPEITCN